MMSILRATALACASIMLASSGALARRSAEQQPSAPAANESAVADPSIAANSGNARGVDLYRHLTKLAPGESLLISPYGVDAALSMLYLGARGTTRTELQKGLRTNASPLELARSHRALSAALGDRVKSSALEKGDRPLSLTVANALWGAEDVQFQPAFVSLLSSEFGAPLRSFDSPRATEAALSINRWAAASTNHRISNIVSAADLSGASTVLANALYFAATWERKFEKAATKDEPFYGLAATARVPMMHSTLDMQYGQFGDADVVELPYKGKDLSFILVLPKSISAFESSMDGSTIAKARGSLGKCTVDFSMPQMKSGKAYELGGSLKALGVRDVFSPNADLSAMDTRAGKKVVGGVSKVIHKTFLELDESGTEAAAVTAIVAPPAAPHAPQCAARVAGNRPFVFVVYDRPTGAILFMGRMTSAD